MPLGAPRGMLFTCAVVASLAAEGYASGLDRDQAAARAGLILVWSNKQTEGQVNRLKTRSARLPGPLQYGI